jgi:hypothetical protein
MATTPMPYELSPHARRRLDERGIDDAEIRAVLSNRRRNVYRSHPGTHADWRYRHVDEQDLVVVTDGDHIVTAFHNQDRLQPTA